MLRHSWLPQRLRKSRGAASVGGRDAVSVAASSFGDPGADDVALECSVISKEMEAEILRLHHVEKWPIGTIGSLLGVHHETVERVLREDGVPTPRCVRPSLIDPYIPFIVETWRKYNRLTASRIFRMCQERGYPGKPGHFRSYIAPFRPKRAAEAFLRLKTLRAEQAQVDWGHFGKVQIGRAIRPLMAFVMVLSYSRAIALRFFLGQHMENFLRGHESSFRQLGGVAKVLLYDNLKSVVLERLGDAIRFHPTLFDFAGFYRYEPRPVAVARGNEKGRVERAIRYVRSAFFPARRWRDLADLNAQAAAWCEGEALDRPWPEDHQRTVRQAFEQERSLLLPLPDNSYPVEERKEIKVGKTPYVRFDGNDYSVPHDRVRRVVTVLASETEVRILDGIEEVARHQRSYDRRAQVENPAHIAALVEFKRSARQHRGLDMLSHGAPSCRKLVVSLTARGGNPGFATVKLLKLFDLHGAAALEVAAAEALALGRDHVEAVRMILERKSREAGQPPVLPVSLPEDPKIRNIHVRPHSLGDYDALATGGSDASED